MAWTKISVLLIDDADIALIGDFSAINTPGSFDIILKSGLHLTIRESDGAEAWDDVRSLYDRIRAQVP